MAHTGMLLRCACKHFARCGRYGIVSAHFLQGEAHDVGLTLASPAERVTYRLALSANRPAPLRSYPEAGLFRRRPAQDILVDVFVAALEQEGFFAWASQEQQAWLWRVARNKTVDLYRRHTRQHSVPLSLDEELALKQDSGDPEQITLIQEKATQLHRFIERLSPVQQQVLQLRFSADLRCSQIAVTLGKREGTIRSILARTLNQLRRWYEHHPEGRETAR